MGAMYLAWDVPFFPEPGHTLVGIVGLLLPLAWFGLAWRAHEKTDGS